MIAKPSPSSLLAPSYLVPVPETRCPDNGTTISDGGHNKGRELLKDPLPSYL